MQLHDSPQIVVIDDESYICSIIVEAMSAEGFQVRPFSDPAAALVYIEDNPVDLVLTDLVMGEFTGIQVLETTLRHHRDAIVILMTAHPTVQTAIAVLKKGAYDFLVKPFKLDILKVAIRRGLDHQKIIRDNINLKGQVDFLKVANAGGADWDMGEFLALVVDSCRKELAAEAVCAVELAPDTGEQTRIVWDSDSASEGEPDERLPGLVTLRCSDSARPSIARTLCQVDGQSTYELLVSQPVVVQGRLHAVINLRILNRYGRIPQGQLDVLNILANTTASSMANHRLYQELRRSYLEAIRGLANAIEARDPYTAGHTDRVCKIATLIAERLGWSRQELFHLAMGCTLHDIGKIGVPDSILNKQSALTPEERLLMKSHAQMGLRIIGDIALFRPAVPYIVSHHEAYDGSGYPKGLRGNEIPLEGRVLAVADTFDAILSDRPYRKGRALRTALEELLTHSGTQFDPEIVMVLMEVVRNNEIDFEAMYGREEDIAQVSGLLRETLIPRTQKAPA